MCRTAPVAYVVASTSCSVIGADRPLNNGRPSPSATGLMTRRYSSTRPARDSACTNDAPPQATMSPPDSCRSAEISSGPGPQAHCGGQELRLPAPRTRLLRLTSALSRFASSLRSHASVPEVGDARRLDGPDLLELY